MTYQNNKIIYLFPSSLFFLMMFLPQTHQEIKYVLLCFSLIFGIFIATSSKFYYSKTFFFWFYVYIGFYLIWISLGFLNGNPGVIDFFRIQVLWPFIFVVLVSYINSQKIIYHLFKMMIITSLIISIYNIYNFLVFINIAPFLLDLTGDFAVGIHSGYSQITSLSINTLTFLMPFIIGTTITSNDLLKNINVSRTLLIVTLIACILCTILSGRRIFWLIYIFNIIVIIIIRRSQLLLYKRIVTITLMISIILILFVSFNLILDLDHNVIIKRFVLEVDLSSNNARNYQRIALMNGFYENPIIGSGFGVGVKDIIRSAARVWTYELTYHLYLYNTGIIGITIFLSCLVYPIVWGVNLFRRDPSLFNIIFPIIIGYMSVLIASATNPILTSSFDFEWMLFLPIGILNCLEITFAKQA